MKHERKLFGDYYDHLGTVNSYAPNTNTVKAYRLKKLIERVLPYLKIVLAPFLFIVWALTRKTTIKSLTVLLGIGVAAVHGLAA